MAEHRVLEGLLGGDAEEGESAAAPLGADPFVAAMAVNAAERGERLDPRAAAYLEKQARLVEIQTEHLHEQRAVQISHLKLRRLSDRLRAGMQVFIALLATVLGLGLAVMIHDAFTSRSVVVNAFKAPSALAARGLTGDVVASDLLDDLQKLQEATRGASKGLNTTSAWSSDVKIEVPETGVSIGEVNRLLHERFGHDLHIDGDLVQTDAGALALTVRGDGVPAKTFQGAPGDLDKLTTQAAEYVYGRSQPFQFQTYLIDVGRYDDAMAFLPGAFARATSDAERADLANGWGNAYVSQNKPGRAIGKYRLAMTLASPYSSVWWKAWGNLIGGVDEAQGEEAGWRESRAFLEAMARAPKSQRPAMRLVLNPAQITWDLPLLLAGNLTNAARNAGAGAATVAAGPSIADIYGLMHDPARAARYMAASDPDDPATKAEVPLLAGYAALDRGDAAAAIPPLEAFWTIWRADPNIQYSYSDSPCLLGGAYGMAGRMAEAEAVFKRMGPWSRCAAVRGDALEHAGDLAGAQRVWAESLKIAPDLPLVYLHRGLSELNRGDLAAAEADLATASAKAPHFADPLKAWGDLLAREGRWKAALAKYDEALKYAPAWAALHQARDAAARKS